MESSPTASTFTTDSRKQSYHIHNLLWEDAEDYQLSKGPKKPKKKDKRHPKSRPQSFTYVLLNILGSCIGNIWRFPAAAYLYGGGTFLVAYFVVLIFVAKPIFYLEVAMGQFTGKGSGKWWCVCPALRGIAVGQFIASVAMVSYYGVFSSFALLYLIQAFNIKIPWVNCKDVSKTIKCFDSNLTTPLKNPGTNIFPFSDIFFRQNFLREISSLSFGIYLPDTGLLIYLLIVWLFVGVLIYNGIKTTGSFAYVGATLPYLMLFIMVIKTVNLPGASNSLNYLFTYDSEALNEKTWYMAAIQAFLSLNSSVGVASYLSSQRNFRHRLNRYIFLITLLDIILVLLASSVVFATLGTLAHVTGKKVNDTSVYMGGIELAAVIYTDALPKASKHPEGLAVFFLLTLTIVGIGSTAVVMHSIMSTVWDVMPRVSAKIMAPVFAFFGFALGAIYLSRTGMSIMQLVDHYILGGIVYHMAIWEVAAIAYIYGLEKYCKDITFMTRRKIHVYWRLCLGLVTPGLLIKIIVFYNTDSEWRISYRGRKYPTHVLNILYMLQYLGEVMIILWLLIELFSFCIGRIRKKPRKFGIVPNSSYGPEDSFLTKDWKRFIDGLKRCTWKEMKYLPQKVLYPFKVLLGTLHDDVFH
ncbi:hypothetical protein J437_LFUL012481 [Ladona fulva]|uniref:Sodium-dependent nutrient amino acid transporter 1 n=1 Tax=Ladona fulva TaxID=123851 RepID=A0A8K0P205_LADFU|nr:hypothetical protein J437_LFUL012481 [Ladona fulva]